MALAIERFVDSPNTITSLHAPFIQVQLTVYQKKNPPETLITIIRRVF